MICDMTVKTEVALQNISGLGPHMKVDWVRFNKIQICAVQTVLKNWVWAKSQI